MKVLRLRDLWPTARSDSPKILERLPQTRLGARNRLRNRTGPIPGSVEGDSKQIWPQITTALARVEHAAKNRTREDVGAGVRWDASRRTGMSSEVGG